MLRAIRTIGRGRKGVTLPGNALPHEPAEGQRETLVVAHHASRARRTAGRLALSGISSSAKWKPNSLKRPALICFIVLEKWGFVTQPDALLVGWAQVQEV